MTTGQARIALVVQRYGPDILGGAEVHARLLAEKLHSDLGYQVTVYTTTARSYHSWARVYGEGEEISAGIRVKRFHAWRRRRWLFGPYKRLTQVVLPLLHKFPRAERITRWWEWLWIILQGPFTANLVSALVADTDQYDHVIFMTYLYFPTLMGSSHVPDKAVLIPLAHDEPPFHFAVVRRMLNRVPVILANTEPEAQLIRSKLDGSGKKVFIAGVGLDPAGLVPLVGGPSGPPYVLYLGRICKGKGVGDLIAWFQAFHATGKAPGLILKLAGNWESDLPETKHPAIEYLGFVDESSKVELIRNATVLVNPSPNESLSMIVIEAMALQVPVIVNDRCDVLAHYARETTTVRGCRDAASFARCLETVLTNEKDVRSPAALASTRAWVLDRYSWSSVLGAVQRALTLY